MFITVHEKYRKSTEKVQKKYRKSTEEVQKKYGKSTEKYRKNTEHYLNDLKKSE